MPILYRWGWLQEPPLSRKQRSVYLSISSGRHLQGHPAGQARSSSSNALRHTSSLVLDELVDDRHQSTSRRSRTGSHAKAQQPFFSQSKDSAGASKGKSGAAATATTLKQAGLKSTKTSSGKRNSGGAAPTNARAPKASVPPTEGCLFCKGPHWLRECPAVTEQQCRATLERFKEAKQQRVDSIRLKSAGAGHARYMATLNGVLEVPYLLETGADRSMLPSDVLHGLEAAAPPVTVHQLARPVTVILADGRTTNCVEEALLDLQLTTAAGIVNIHRVPCLVMSSEDDELLDGSDTLSSLGIGVEGM
ncbi:hypothetical protein PC116_g24094 [Phytophthora cactorum]|uniref:Uncharacterized protein n=1 Tax=Phytophthora cactorum TaxID=29920 RepID=A0A8T1AZ43_9STRA|nr:hypothetical protein PC114_g21956 [Phytophthora cactorum]KAG2890398.1 hypothetical protein PC115_g19514 [Phytophthora cactorum]KAG4227521.1 hypothetical protein PC116_g24094 [Phytophthora cactorum]